MGGWIKLYRDISLNWIWDDPIKLKWWLDILITVNHSPSKVNIGMQIYECGIGQSIMSLSNWANRWKVSKDKARNFFVLLEKDGMILHESLGKTTRITVCKYDSYQSDLHDSQTIERQPYNDNQTLSHPNKNDKKNKNEKNINSEDKYSSLITSLPKSAKSIVTKCRSIFEDRFLELFNDSYYWEAKDAVNMKYIIQKIKKRRTDKGFGIEDEDITSAFKSFLESISDEWILKNFSITNINSKFNNIISQANGKSIKSNGIAGDKAASRNELDKLADRILGINQPKDRP